MRILYVMTVASTGNFFIDTIRMLQKEGNTVDMAANTSGGISEGLKALNCQFFHIPFSRSPLSRDNIRAYKELKKLLAENRYDIVHTHTPNASALVRLACRKYRKTGTRVFYTAHGFHFYTGAPAKNWLLYYPVERFLSRWTDVLITMNREDLERARKFKAGRVEFVHGVGVDLARFNLDGEDGKRQEKRRELGVGENDVLVLAVGELIKRKNHETLIRAVAALKDTSIRCLIAGEGPLHGYLEELIASLGLQDRVKLLGRRTDIAELDKAADIFALPSYQEGLPVALMEAMASGKPAVCSDIRGNRDLIEPGAGGSLCPVEQVSDWAGAIAALSRSPGDRTARGANNRRIVQAFSTEKVLDEMKRIYGIS